MNLGPTHSKFFSNNFFIVHFGLFLINQIIKMSDPVEICNRLLQEGDSILAAEDKKNHFETISVLLMQLKSANRLYYSELDKQRALVDVCKGKVDEQQLYLDNLSYEMDHWQRQIRNTKDLNIPEIKKFLQSVVDVDTDDNSIVKNLCNFDSAAELEPQQETYLKTLENEQILRENSKAELMQKQTQQFKLAEKIEKKRKFIEELPARISAMKTIAVVIQPLITAVIDTPPSADVMAV